MEFKHSLDRLSCFLRFTPSLKGFPRPSGKYWLPALVEYKNESSVHQKALAQSKLGYFLLERRGIVRFLQNAGYDDEYVKRKKLGQDSPTTRFNTLPMECDGERESEWIVFAIYYQQAWEFSQNHRSIGERLRWAARAETLADVIGHHMLCNNHLKAFNYWNARQSEASHFIQALQVSLQSEID